MSRASTPDGWHDAAKSKPHQGERVILKVAIDGEQEHVIGYWGFGWEVCTTSLRTAGEDIEPNFTNEDVLAYHILP